MHTSVVGSTFTFTLPCVQGNGCWVKPLVWVNDGGFLTTLRFLSRTRFPARCSTRTPSIRTISGLARLPSQMWRSSFGILSRFSKRVRRRSSMGRKTGATTFSKVRTRYQDLRNLLMWVSSSSSPSITAAIALSYVA